MKKTIVLALACLPTCAFGQMETQTSASATSPVVQDVANPNAPPMLGIHWVRGFEPSFRALEENKRFEAGSPTAARSSSSALMTYHGGKIMPVANTEAIFWGLGWNSNPGDKITGMDSWYQGFGNSTYAAASNEYTGTNGQVTSTSNYAGHVVDGSASSGGGNTSAILAEVCKVIRNPDTSGNGYYAVYSDTKRGGANYCAYHSAGTCGGVSLQFAFFFNVDGDSGCSSGDTSGLHSEGLSAIANTSAHELSEARSDPSKPGAWYDGSGQENGDKCAYIYPSSLVTFSNGSRWKVQGEWSNHAYSAGTGYPNSSGQKGCIE